MPFFEPTSAERRGLVVLCLALILAVAVGVYVRLNPPAGEPPAERRRVGDRVQRYYAVPEKQVETFPFDPNTADSTALLRLGFAPFQVRGIYKYRAMGGRYHEPSDVKRIPGMTNELWERLEAYIRIDRKYKKVEITPPDFSHHPSAVTTEDEPLHRDTVRFPIKLQEGSVISLNEADTSQLKKVPGIGSYYARQIVRYREQLGGYVSLSQLQEIEGMPEGVEQWLRIDTTAIRHIDVNHATKNQLVRHPYLRVYRASAIWNHRHNNGPLRSIDELRALPDFTESDIQRLEPYLVFD